MTRRLAPVLASLGLWALLAGVPSPAQAQCSMCKTLLTQSPEGRAMSAQFNNAILVMLVAPYLIVGSLAVALFKERIGAQVSRLARGIPHPRRLRGLLRP